MLTFRVLALRQSESRLSSDPAKPTILHSPLNTPLTEFIESFLRLTKLRKLRQTLSLLTSDVCSTTELQETRGSRGH